MFFDLNKDGKVDMTDARIWAIRYGVWTLLFVLMGIFIMLLEDVLNNEIMTGDVMVYNFLSSYLMNDVSTAFYKFITNFGGVIGIFLITALLIIFVKDIRKKLLIPLNVLLVFLLNQCLKFIVQRPRPDEFRIIDESGYSFPSGHSMVSMAFYGFLIWLIYKYIQKKKLKIALISFCALLIPLVGISRIYLGVHYASDVLAGFCISLAYLVLYIMAVERWILKDEKPKPA